jgi:tetratricopeptide (TPR) repeat protein
MRSRLPTRPPELPAEHPALALRPGLGNAALARRLARKAETEITAPGITGAQQWHERGLEHYRAKRYEQARAAFAEAYRLNAISTFLYDQADALEQLGRDAEAAEMYERYLAAGPLTADVPKVQARIRKLRGEHVAEADDEPPITATGKAGATAWFDRAQSAFMARRYTRAAECFRKAFELAPLPQFIYDEAVALEQGGHATAAANAYEHYLILDQQAKDAPEVIAKIKALRGQAPAQTRDSLMDPEDDAATAPLPTAQGVDGARQWFDRGTVAFEVGDFHRAYECFVAAYDLKPYPAFVFNQAASLDMLGNVDAAVQAYERYLALDPKATDGEKVRRRIQRLREGPTGIKPP